MFKMSFLVLMLALTWVLVTAQSDTIVRTVYGDVEGHLVTLGNGQVVRSFLGVPFARPPVGDLRFKAPEEPLPWLDVLRADRLGNACPQDNVQIPATNPDFDRFSEDCLNMNIITPYNYPEAGPYPVHVFIYGGAYRNGANVQFVGHYYAARGIVTVAMNYRLGQLGFLYTGDDSARGNYGLLDQILALRFLQQNVGNFGGDPNKVTISGISAGGSSVGQLILSPMARGLFQQAIMMSGSDLSPWSINRPEVSANVTRQVADDLNCLDEDTQIMVDCLRDLPVEEVMNATWFPEPSLGATLGFVPVPDATDGVLPDYPSNLRERNEFSRVNVMVGSTDKEMAILFLLDEEGFNSTEFREVVEDFVEDWYVEYGSRAVEDISKAVIFQYSPWPRIENKTANRDNAVQMYNDLWYGAPMEKVLRSHAAYNNTFNYIFGYRSLLLDEDFPRWTGAFHASDMAYFSGWALLQDNPEVAQDMEMLIANYTQTDKEYANYWTDLVANFVKSGNPTPAPVPGPGGKPATTWPPYRLDAMNYLEIYNKTILVKQNLCQRSNALWREYVPWIISHTSSFAGKQMIL